jgi:hypothetical protein
MWQLYANEALEIARARHENERRRQTLYHPGAIDHWPYEFAPEPVSSGPGIVRRTSARLAAAVSSGAAGVARALDASSLDADEAPTS